jgi:hypothetical protein
VLSAGRENLLKIHFTTPFMLMLCVDSFTKSVSEQHLLHSYKRYVARIFINQINIKSETIIVYGWLVEKFINNIHAKVVAKKKQGGGQGEKKSV